MVEKKKGFQIFAHFVMIFIAVCSVALYILLVMSSITEEKSTDCQRIFLFPKEFSLYAYQYLLTGSGSPAAFLCYFFYSNGSRYAEQSDYYNSFYAYPLSRKELPGA